MCQEGSPFRVTQTTLLKRTQSIAHNKNTRKGRTLFLHPTLPYPLKKKVLIGTQSLPFCRLTV